MDPKLPYAVMRTALYESDLHVEQVRPHHICIIYAPYLHQSIISC